MFITKRRSVAHPAFAVALLAGLAIAGAQAQALKVDAQTSIILPADVADCSAPDTQSGSGIVEQSANCPQRGGITRYEITVVTGGGHLREPAKRLAAALDRADVPLVELSKKIQRKELKTKGKPIRLACVETRYDDDQREVTCVRDEPLTRIEYIAESPDAEKAWALMNDIVAASELK